MSFLPHPAYTSNSFLKLRFLVSHLKHSAYLFFHFDSKTSFSPTHCRLKVDFWCSVNQLRPQPKASIDTMCLVSVNLAIHATCCQQLLYTRAVNGSPLTSMTKSPPKISPPAFFTSTQEPAQAISSVYCFSLRYKSVFKSCSVKLTF